MINVFFMIGKELLVMLGGGMYEVSTCPKCGERMWNGRCENTDCSYHWHPLTDEGDEKEEDSNIQ